MVTAGCLAATAGAGSIGCMAAGGAAASAATNLWRTRVQRTQAFSWSSLARDTVIGGALGAAGGVAGRVAQAVAPAASRVSTGVSNAASRVSTAISNGASRLGNALRSRFGRTPPTAADAVPNEGIYVVRTAADDVYVGQSGDIAGRLARHVTNGKFTQAEADAAQRFEVLGGKTAREIAEQLKLDSFGGRDAPGVLNRVNPIGDRRLNLMPEGYIRP